MKNSLFARWLNIAMRIVIALMVSLWCGQRWGHYYIDALLPLYRVVLDGVVGDYTVVHIGTALHNGEKLVVGSFLNVHSLRMAGRTLPAGMTIDASTLAAHALKHFAIIVSAVLIWPGLTLQQRGIRLLLSIFPLLLLEAVDIPLVLVGAVQELVAANVPPSANSSVPWLIRWLHFLDGGGRFALSLFVALAVGFIHESNTVALHTNTAGSAS